MTISKFVTFMLGANSGVQAVFEEYGITGTKSGILSKVAESAEDYVREVVRMASLIQRNSRGERLAPKHINILLESLNQPPLLGYSNSPSFLLSSVTFETSELHFIKDPKITLDGAMSIPAPSLPRVAPYGFQWFLTEGVPTERSQTRQHRPPTISHGSERNHLGSSQEFTSEPLRPSSVDTSSRSYSTRQFAGDILSAKLQDDYIRTINLLKDDISNSKLKALKFLGCDPGIQPLLPYFLQFVFGELSMHFNDPILTKMALEVALALSGNKYLCITLFAHAFLRIALSILLAPDNSSRVIDEECEIREIASNILGNTVDRCEDAYPGIRISVYNALVDAFLNEKTTLIVHFGAISGIGVLGKSAIYRIIPHIPIYIKMINSESEIRLQRPFVEKIFQQISFLINSVKIPDELAVHVKAIRKYVN